MSIGEIITTIVLGVVGNLIAAFLLGAYKKRRENGACEVESIALDLLKLAVSILPIEDRAKLYDRWLADLVDLDTSFLRIKFASGLPLGALALRSKASLALPFVAAMKLVRSTYSNARSNECSTVARNTAAQLGKRQAAKQIFFYALLGLIMIVGAQLAFTYIGFTYDVIVSQVKLSGLDLNIGRFIVFIVELWTFILLLVDAVFVAFAGYLYLVSND